MKLPSNKLLKSKQLDKKPKDKLIKPDLDKQPLGLYTSPDEKSFKPLERIKHESLAKPEGDLIHNTPLQTGERSFDDWTKVVRQRQADVAEVLRIPTHADITINTEKPAVIALIGDVHAGADVFDIDLFERHIKVVREHPLFYTMLMGDLVDAFYWSPAKNEDMLNIIEQVQYVKSALDYLGAGKIIAAWAGNHDLWASKMGPTLYHDFVKKYQTHYFEGPSTVSLTVGNVKYRIVGSHKLPGSSMYNEVHPAKRASKFGIQGADIYVAGHIHTKGMATSVSKTFPTPENPTGEIDQWHITIGPYKYGDMYARNEGFGNEQGQAERGAVFLLLDPITRNIQVYKDIDDVMRIVYPYLEF